MPSLEFAVFLKRIPKLVWIAVVCALAINIFGLAFIFTHYNQEVLIAGDGQVYLKLAENLHQGLGFGLFAKEGFVSETFRTPGLPFLFAMFSKLCLKQVISCHKLPEISIYRTQHYMIYLQA